MKKTIATYVLPLFSFSSMVVGIDDICASVYWRVFIIAIVISLIIYSIISIRRKTHWSIVAVSLMAAIILGLTVIIDYNAHKKAEQVAERCREYLREKKSISNDSTLESKAIDENSAVAQLELSKNYLFGKNGYSIDYKLAKEFAQRSADQGNADARDLLANIYLRGRGCKPDTTQAISNMVLSLKEGKADVSRFILKFDLHRLHLAAKDSILVNTSYSNAAFLDSLCALFFIDGKLKHEVFLSTIKTNESRICNLSDNGYSRATELLYYRAIALNDQKMAHLYSSQLYERGRIPDYPLMRYFFFSHCFGHDFQKVGANTSFVDKCKSNQCYLSLGMKSEYQSIDIFRDNFYQCYEYNLAQFNRAKYLKDNLQDLYMPVISFEEDIVECYEFAKKCLSKATERVNHEMINQPYYL